MNNALFPLFCCRHTQHKSCTQFSYFQIIRQNVVNDGFQYPVLYAIILQLAQWSSFRTTATRAMFSFVYNVPSLLLHSTSSIVSSSATNRLCHQNTWHRQVTKHFYKHFPSFRSRNSCFTTKFYRGTLFKIFFHGNL